MCLIAIFFSLDRIFKHFSFYLLEEKSIIGNLIKFVFVPNKFISFSIPVGGKYLLYFIFFILIFLFFYAVFLVFKKRINEFLGIFCLFLGAFSNFFDRVKYSFVIDYIDLKYFAVFNLADILIFLATIYLFFYYYKQGKK